MHNWGNSKIWHVQYWHQKLISNAGRLQGSSCAPIIPKSPIIFQTKYIQAEFHFWENITEFNNYDLIIMSFTWDNFLFCVIMCHLAECQMSVCLSDWTVNTICWHFFGITLVCSFGVAQMLVVIGEKEFTWLWGYKLFSFNIVRV